MNKAIARSFRDVAMAKAHIIEELLLSRSEDLVCKNVMCGNLGDACACRLSQILERLPNLIALDISYNKLRSIPEAVFTLKKLQRLNVRGNRITYIPDVITSLQGLKVLDLSHNMLVEIPHSTLQKLPSLETLRTDSDEVAASEVSDLAP